MYIMKGFISMSSLALNTPNTPAIFGEMSTYIQTFTRTLTHFGDTENYPNSELATFKMTDDAGNPVIASETMTDMILALGNFLYLQHVAGSIPPQSSAGAFLTSLNSEFPDFNAIVIGQILLGAAPGRYMPEWIQFTYNDAGNTYQVKLWTCDDSFRTQYDQYEIFVIPPVPSIATLQAPTATVTAALLNVTPGSVLSQIPAITDDGNLPQTKVISISLICHDPNNPTSTCTTDWTAVVYGRAGLDTDAIYAEIAAYIASNSVETNWNIIYPQLFAEYEFIIIPLWDNIAAPPNSVSQGIYSASARVGSLTSIAQTRLPASYAAAANLATYLATNLTINGTVYQSMMFLALGNPNNASAIYKLSTQYPDYMAIDTASADFNRMTLVTQEFVTRLLLALQEASTYVSTLPVPLDYTVGTFGGQTFLGFTYEGYTYYVLTQNSY